MVARTGPLEKLRSLFSEKNVIAIAGNSAMGKTELAKQYAHTYLDSYYHVWFVDVENWEKSYRNLAIEWKLFDPEKINDLDINLIIDSIHSIFGKRGELRNRKSLIIFDNAPAGFIGIKLKGILPRNTDVLVTSKDSDWETVFDMTAEEYQLTEKEGLMILQNWLPTQKYDAKQAEIIVRRFINLPVVIAQVGHFIATSPGVSMESYLQSFERNKREVLHQGRLINPNDGKNIDIFVSLMMTVTQIGETDPEAVKLLRYCSFLPGKNIPIKLLKKLSGKDSLSLNHLLKKLDTLLMSNNGHITVHELFQDIIASESRVYQEEILSHLAQDSRGFEDFLMTSPQKAISIFEQGLKNSEKKHENINTAYFAERAGEAFRSSGQFSLSMKRHQKALKLYQNEYGELHQDTATSYNSIGVTLSELGENSQALIFKNKALEIRRQVLGENHLTTAHSYNNVGVTLSELGQHARALTNKEKALEIRKEKLGENHPDTATSYNNVGASLSELDRHTEALTNKKKALEIRERIFSKNHPVIASSCSSIGVTMTDLGKHFEAVRYHKRALRIRSNTLGEDSLFTALSYYNLGVNHTRIGNHAAALYYLRRALKIRQKLLGLDHEDTIKVIVALHRAIE